MIILGDRIKHTVKEIAYLKTLTGLDVIPEIISDFDRALDEVVKQLDIHHPEQRLLAGMILLSKSMPD